MRARIIPETFIAPKYWPIFRKLNHPSKRPKGGVASYFRTSTETRSYIRDSSGITRVNICRLEPSGEVQIERYEIDPSGAKRML